MINILKNKISNFKIIDNLHFRFNNLITEGSMLSIEYISLLISLKAIWDERNLTLPVCTMERHKWHYRGWFNLFKIWFSDFNLDYLSIISLKHSLQTWCSQGTNWTFESALKKIQHSSTFMHLVSNANQSL